MIIKIIPKAMTGLDQATSHFLAAIAQMINEAKVYSRKLMPQIPVTEASCASQENGYWLLAIDPQTPLPPSELRYSITTAAEG